MTSKQCACGFTEAADESLTDHLERVFTPDDMRGPDGQVHEELDLLTCGCGFAADAPEELDEHFLAVFTPGDGIGQDGEKHGPRDA
ncbi:MAG TPA: hypothetical protein VH478_07270 [Trebonia sp.]|jgi:hypothetical protein|nr:hypothetical protein [Trebonia sp.]